MQSIQPLFPKDVDLETNDNFFSGTLGLKPGLEAFSEVTVLKDENGNRFEKTKDGGPKVFYESDFISYKKARENTDNILFVLPPDDENDILFITYSKKQLYEEYMKTMGINLKNSSSGSNPKTLCSNLFFVLDLIEEESYHIPMSHIVRILEYPHPMYLVERSSYSFHVYLTRPCKI